VTAKGKADEMLCWMFDAHLSLSKLLGRLCGANLSAVSRMLNFCFPSWCFLYDVKFCRSWAILLVLKRYTACHFWSWSHITSHLVVFMLLLVQATSLKSPGLRHFKLDRDEIWQECSW